MCVVSFVCLLPLFFLVFLLYFQQIPCEVNGWRVTDKNEIELFQRQVDHCLLRANERGRRVNTRSKLVFKSMSTWSSFLIQGKGHLFCNGFNSSLRQVFSMLSRSILPLLLYDCKLCSPILILPLWPQLVLKGRKGRKSPLSASDSLSNPYIQVFIENRTLPKVQPLVHSTFSFLAF